MRKIRATELAEARLEVDQALRGAGRSLFVTGPAGIGKSMFVADLVADASAASARWCVVRIEGAEQESRMVWAGLSQLVHRLRAHVGSLKSAHQRIIEALADPTAGQSPDTFAAAVSVLALITQAAEATPTMVVIEDHHWLDPDSVRVLDFVGRRLDGIRAVLIATSRTSEVVADAHVTLAPLADDEATHLLTELGMGVVTARDLAAQVGGHPLTLVHAARCLTDDQRAGRDPLPTPLPMSADDLPSSFDRLVRSLPDDTNAALHVLAAAGGLGRGWSWTLDRVGIAPAALTPAEDAAVIEIAADAVRFTHPLWLAAAYAHATPAQRRAAHRTLADIEADPGRALWHASRAIVGHDDEVAARLAVVAAAAAGAGAHGSAFAAWHRAGEISSTEQRSQHYAVLAADAALRAGNNAPAREVIDRRPPLESDDAALVRLAADYEARAGHADSAHELFLRVGDLLEHDHPDGAAQAFLDAARSRLRIGHVGGAADALARLSTLAGRIDDPQLLQHVEIVQALVGSVASGSTNGFVECARTLVPPTGPLVGDLSFLADTVALGLAYQRRRVEAIDLVERLRSAAVERNLPSLIPSIDSAKACALSTVDLPGCMIAASNAVEWADAIGQPNLATAALGFLANVQAALGDPGVFASAARIGAAGTEQAWVTERMMRGFYWTTLGQPERVLEELLPLHDWAGGTLKTVLFWQADLGEAAARAGRIDIAEDVVGQLRSFNEMFPNPWLDGAAARIEGLLADVDECGACFERSTAAFASADILLAQARSELLWGERLRRARRRSEARQHLATARDLFERIGAGRWVERCEHELIASGGAAAPADHTLDADRVLTPQELQIARLCVAGQSNRDIGVALFISARTVETHLSAIYRKLAVKNRAELAAAAAHDSALRVPAD